MRRLGAFVSRYPRWVLGFWVLALVMCLPLALRVGEVLSPDADPAPASVAREVRQVLAQAFAEGANYRVLLIAQSSSLNNTDAAFERAFDEVTAQLRQLPEVVALEDYRSAPRLPLRSADGRSSVALIRLNDVSVRGEREALARIMRLLPAGELEFFLVGDAAVKRALNDAAARDARRAELFGLPLSLIILVLAFGTVVAAGLPLLVAVLTIVVSLALLFLLGQVVAMASFVQTLVSMLGLSTGINYALVMVHRFREELAKGLPPRSAAAATTASAGKAVSLSGLTVLIALTALLLPPLPLVRSLGLGGVVVMLVSVSAAVTALPASLALLGARVNLLRVPISRGQTVAGVFFWRAHAARVLKRPLLFIAAGVLLLLVLTLPAFDMQLTFSRSRGLIGDPGLTRAQALLEQAGLADMSRAFDVLIDFGDRGFYHPVSVRQVSQFARESGALPGVTQVVAATVTPLPPLLVRQYYAGPGLARSSPLAELVAASVSQDGRYALVRVFPAGSLSPRVSSLLAAQLAQLATDTGVNARVGGQPVADAEWARALYGSLPLSVLLVVFGTFIMLGLHFRSVLLPLKAVLLNAFTIGAACGVVVLVFQEGWLAPLFGLPGGLGFIETVVPLCLFALVFGLSMDYEVFVLSRLQEAHRQGVAGKEAVLQAIAATGSIITSAALVMFTVFLMFTFSNVVLIKTLSVGLVVAVLLDATLVRLTLVPALLFLAGRWNWWRPPALSLARFSPLRSGRNKSAP